MSERRDKLFLPYQAQWIKDGSRLKLMEKSRQIGISWATAYAVVRRKSVADAKLDAWVSSRDEIQARLFLEDCKQFAGILQIGAEDFGQQVVDPDRNSAFVLGLANGLRINSMSSNPNAQAGKRGDRILDEFALHPDPRQLYAIAYPGITWGGQMEIVSTHRGSNNFFNELVREIKEGGNPKGISLHTVTLQDALDQGFLERLQSKLPEDDERKHLDRAAYFDLVRAECPDEETFLQEFMCQPSDDASAFLAFDLIDACTYSPNAAWEWEHPPARKSLANPVFIGVDVGRKHDFTSATVLEEVAGTWFTRARIDLEGMPFSQQERTLWPWFDIAQRVAIDNTGLGMQFAERAREKFGYKVEPVTFTPARKEELAYPLRGAFEDRKLRIPDDRVLMADLRAIKRYSSDSTVRFAADRGKNGHADRFWSYALALYAAKTSQGSFAYKPLDLDRAGRRGLYGRSRRTLRSLTA